MSVKFELISMNLYGVESEKNFKILCDQYYFNMILIVVYLKFVFPLQYMYILESLPFLLGSIITQ